MVSKLIITAVRYLELLCTQNKLILQVVYTQEQKESKVDEKVGSTSPWHFTIKFN